LHAVGGGVGLRSGRHRAHRLVLAAPPRDRAPPRRGESRVSDPRPVAVPPHIGALDVAELPTIVFSHRSLMWWGTVGLMAIESTVFALGIVTYFYLRSHADNWPLSTPPPALLWGTVNTAILVVSALPNHLAKRAAERLDRRGVQVWLTVCLLASVAFLVVRWFEFEALNCRWDSDAYGSIVWTLMGLHTFHLITDTWDSVVLDVLFFTGPLEG